MAVIKYFWNDTFEKKTKKPATEVALIHLFSLTVVSKHKIKMKRLNTMVLLYHLKVTSTQNKGVSFLSCLAHGL